MEGPGRRLREAEAFHKLHRVRLLWHLVERHDFPPTMNSPPIWFERKFDFTFPVEQHPNLCARLRGTPARLEEIVRAADHDVLICKPGEYFFFSSRRRHTRLVSDWSSDVCSSD